MSVIRQSERVDLLFVVDSTESMHAQINAVKTQIIKVATQVQKTNPHLRLRVGGVFYRDELDQGGSNTLIDFTDDLGAFVSSVNNVKAFGGGDSCEDVASALRDATKMNWQSPTKVLFHVADTPSHGRRYYDAQETAAAAAKVHNAFESTHLFLSLTCSRSRCDLSGRDLRSRLVGQHGWR